METPYWLDDPAAPRYGPLPGDVRVEVAIVGAGVTGLACARVLALAGRRVRVLETRRVGSGASGRNGGFASRGTALPYDRARLPDVMAATEDALRRVRDLAGDLLRPVGSLRVAVTPDEVEDLRAERSALAEDGFAVEWREREVLPEAVQQLGLAGTFHPPDGSLDQGRWVRRLAGLAQEAGAAIAEETRVTALDGTSVATEHGVVTADAVVVATNGYSNGLVPDLDRAIATVRGQILATAPLADEVLPCPLHARDGFDYVQQLADGRLVAGGRRDVALDKEATRSESTSERIQRQIENLVASLLDGRVPPITHRWAGLMGFTADRLPLVGELPGRPGVWVSAGYSGHGNVLGFACGEAVGQALLGEPPAWVERFSPGRPR